MTVDSVRILSADSSRQVEALRMLFSRFPLEEQTARLEDTLLAVQRGALDLSGLMLAEQCGRSVGAALVMRQADGIALVWPPVIDGAEEDRQVGQELMAALCRELDGPDVRFGQCLLSPEELAESAWLRQFGFEPAAELFFLARTLEIEVPEADGLPNGTVEIFAESENAARFAALIERTYERSLDCPLLNGRRTGVDALASHRLSGQFHPRGWRLYRQEDRDAAVLLLNEHPDQDAVELVYFGVAPEFRGQSWGRRLVTDAITLSRSWKRAAIFLAVDAGNTFATQLYAGCGFQEVARRSVWIRFPPGSARQ